MKIEMGSFRFKAELSVAESMIASDESNVVRLMIVRQKNYVESALFDPPSCLYNDGQTTPLSIYAQPNTRYCEVLWDKTYQLQQNTNGGRYPTRPFSFFIDEVVMLKKKVTYKPVADGQSPLPRDHNHFYFIGMSDSSVAPHPRIEGSSVTWFKNIE